MPEPTAPGVAEVERYRPCGHCRRCVSGAPLGAVEPTPDDCYSLYLERSTAAHLAARQATA